MVVLVNNINKAIFIHIYSGGFLYEKIINLHMSCFVNYRMFCK